MSLAVVACAASLGFSHGTAALARVVDLPVGTPALVMAVLVTAPSPRSFGWTWGETFSRWRSVALSTGAVVLVAGGFRVLTEPAPYDASVAEFLVVPLGEEALFRGVVLVLLLRVLRVAFDQERTAVTASVLISAVAFGAGHLGNAGTVPAEFLVVQVLAAGMFGVLAGWLRVHTESLVGPVLLHVALNVVSVA